MADDFEGIEENSFDTVVLNSIVQYFPSIEYLLRVLEGAARCVKPGGHVFVGDVRNLLLLEALHTSIELEHASASTARLDLQERVRRRMAQEEELVVDPAFFEALEQHVKKIGDVEVRPKRGLYINELTQFRYDVVLRIGDAESGTRCEKPEASLSTTWAEYGNDPLRGMLRHKLAPELRRFLRAQVPEYMVPASYVVLDFIPLTHHGKIDRAALPSPSGDRPRLDVAYVPPSSETEKELARIWVDVLGVDRIGIHDNFFDLGGHSLMIIQLMSRLRKSFRVELPLRDVFAMPTIKEIADMLEAKILAKASAEKIDRLLARLEDMDDKKAVQILGSGETSGEWPV